MIVRDKLYINGQWVPSSGTGMINVICSSTEEVMAQVPEGTAEDADVAVRAASAAEKVGKSTPFPNVLRSCRKSKRG